MNNQRIDEMMRQDENDGANWHRMSAEQTGCRRTIRLGEKMKNNSENFWRVLGVCAFFIVVCGCRGPVNEKFRAVITHELAADSDLSGIQVQSLNLERNGTSKNKYKGTLKIVLKGEEKNLDIYVTDGRNFFGVGTFMWEFDEVSAKWVSDVREKERLRREEEERKERLRREEEERKERLRREEEERKERLRREEEENRKHAEYCIAHDLLLEKEAFEELYTALHYRSQTGNEIYDDQKDREMRAKYKNSWVRLEGTIKEVIDDYSSIRIIFTINNHTISAVFQSSELSKYDAMGLKIGSKMRFYGRISNRWVLSDIAMDDCVVIK